MIGSLGGNGSGWEKTWHRIRFFRLMAFYDGIRPLFLGAGEAPHVNNIASLILGRMAASMPVNGARFGSLALRASSRTSPDDRMNSRFSGLDG